MIETLKKELHNIEEDIYYLEAADNAWSPTYSRLCKQRKILRRAIKKLERLEARAR